MPNIIELFAGVGGFRVGLESRANEALGDNYYNVIWSNQWEPATKTQHAFRTYERRYGEGSCVNKDIAEVIKNPALIPDAEMLCGGFPCQDYSVARTLRQAAGIEGKKGVLWWSIYNLVHDKVEQNHAPTVLFLENVDRLVQSPASQRGRDFAIILESLSELGYNAEWRIINAAEYGMPQRRRRTYILAYRHDSPLCFGMENATRWIFKDGVFAHAFPVLPYEGAPLVGQRLMKKGDKDLADLSEHFNAEYPDRRVFQNAGVMTNGVFYTYKTEADYGSREGENFITLGDIVRNTPREYVTEDFFIPEDGPSMASWRHQKGAKKEKRVNKSTGFEYMYSEGGMPFPDPLDKPSRTIITGEGGKTPSRFKHVIEDVNDPVIITEPDGTTRHRYRRLVPIELEQLDMFPINHTAGESAEKRAFFMGNALVCGIVEKVGVELAHREW